VPRAKLRLPQSRTYISLKRLISCLMEVQHAKTPSLRRPLRWPFDRRLVRSGGGMGSHHSALTSGAAGTSATSPSTNSLGTALSSGTGNGRRLKGPTFATSPAIDREEAKVNKMIASICRGFWDCVDANRRLCRDAHRWRQA